MSAAHDALLRWLHGLGAREAVTAAVDILAVYYLVYRGLLLVKGTRAAQMLVGLSLVAAAFFLARLFELTTLLWLLDNVLNYSVIFVIVIFQRDIRRGLTRVGSNLAAFGRPHEVTHVFEEVFEAAEELARARVGALIVLERDAFTDEFLRDPGEEVDGRVCKQLLVAIFLPSPHNPLHDGAVVIRNLRLLRAGAVLPLSANASLDKTLGTRHRAALGITEETDAVVVVVSEERGAVSLCFDGRIAQDLDGPALRRALLRLFQRRRRAEASESRASREVTRRSVVVEGEAPVSRPPVGAAGSGAGLEGQPPAAKAAPAVKVGP